MLLLLKATLLQLWHSLIVSPILATAALLINPIRVLFESESDFFAILTLALMIDLLIGMLKHLKINNFSFRDLALGLIIKVVVAYGGLLLFMSFASLEDGPIVEWFIFVSKFTILLYPAGSAFSNMFILTDGRFPPLKFMKKLKSFDEIITPASLLIEERERNEKNRKDKS